MIAKLNYLWDFFIKQVYACLFPALLLLGLIFTSIIDVPRRYDVLFFYALIIQIIFYLYKLETKKEILVICIFHLLGLLLEIFKVSKGIWQYPGSGYIRLFDVPLYSGFMYASVASYMMQSFKVLKLRVENWPKTPVVISIALLIYGNFFTNYYIYDIRYLILVLLFFFFYRTNIYYTLREKEFKMPVLASFFLMSIFLWIAENIGTFFGAWQYGSQVSGWHLVNFSILISWMLLVIVSFIIVITLKEEKSSTGRINTNKKEKNALQ